jgi:hypothetical protein
MGISEMMAIGSMVLSAGGAAATYEGNQTATNAGAIAVKDENDAQQQQIQGLQNTLNQSLAHQSAQSQAQMTAQNAANRAKAYAQAANTAIAGGVSAPTGADTTDANGKPVAAINSNQDAANRIVGDTFNRDTAKVGDFLTQQGNVKANLDAVGDTQLGNALYNTNQGYKTQMFSDFMKSNQDLLPLQLAAASTEGDQYKGIGSALSAAGSVAGMGAGMMGGWGSLGNDVGGWFSPSSTAVNSSKLAPGSLTNLGLYDS